MKEYYSLFLYNIYRDTCGGKTAIKNVYKKGTVMGSDSFIVDLEDLAGLEKGQYIYYYYIIVFLIQSYSNIQQN